LTPALGQDEDHAPEREQGAVVRVYEENVTPVYRFLYARVGNQEDAEDLTSQVFMKAVRHLDGARADLSIKSWLFQLARTTLADHWRQYYKEPKMPLQLLVPERPQEKPAEETGAAAETVRLVLAELPDHYQRVLTLRFLEGLSIKETAAEMGITENNVKVLQLRALRRAADRGAHLL
jgi:RNA polymerase sigma-70 factor (ECF subfamily)